jgi:hypothetical protein
MRRASVYAAQCAPTGRLWRSPQRAADVHALVDKVLELRAH